MCAVALCCATGCDGEAVDDGAETSAEGGETGDIERQTWEVDGSLAVCRGEGAWLCQRVRSVDGGLFSALPCPIDGFEFVWGERAEVVVEPVDFHDPAVDGCGTEYALVEERERWPVGADASFTLRLKLPRDVTEGYFVLAEAGHATFMGVEMVCTTDSACEALPRVIDGNAPEIDLSLRHPDSSGEPFRLYAVCEAGCEAG